MSFWNQSRTLKVQSRAMDLSIRRRPLKYFLPVVSRTLSGAPRCFDAALGSLTRQGALDVEKVPVHVLHFHIDTLNICI